MSWNRPSEAKKIETKKPAYGKGIFAAVAVVGVAAIVMWFMFGQEDVKRPAKPQPKPVEKIRQVSPAVTNKVEAPAKPIDPKEDYDHEIMYRDKHGALRYKSSGCRAPDPTRKLGKVFNASSMERKVFKHPGDRKIASFLKAQPGMIRFGGGQNYHDPNFINMIKEALASDTELVEPDNVWDQEMQAAVKATKEDLKKRIAAGEDIGDIFTETDKELTRLREYAVDIEKMISQHIKDGNGAFSTDDIKDLVAAANKMLEDNGVNPISDDSFIKWNLQLMAKSKGEDPVEAVREYTEAQELKEQQELEKEANESEAK